VKKYLSKLGILVLILSTNEGLTHDRNQASARYLANEAVMVSVGSHKVLFDPFFSETFGIYQKMPDAMLRDIEAATPPYDDIDLIVISHAHADHFDARRVLAYLIAHPSTHLVGPLQAIAAIRKIQAMEKLPMQLHEVSLQIGDAAVQLQVNALTIDAVRIPHAGWPSRAEVENLVFRVSLEQGDHVFPEQITVMHMGDADPDIDHFLPHRQHWQSKTTHLVFPPYWFFASAEGRDILQSVVQARQQIGVHVPVAIPMSLQQGTEDFFSRPGELRVIDAGAAK
jgi:L-ascorbate metabolism protein UlaG (beta-lactamase superfamily)